MRPPATHRPAPRFRAARTTVGAAVYCLLLLAGRATVLDGTSFALVGIASGWAVLWFLWNDVDWRSPDVSALALASLLATTSSGEPLSSAVAYTVAHVVQNLVVCALLRSWVPEVADGRTAFTALRTLGWFLAALTVGVLAGCLAGAALLAVAAEPPGWITGLLWFGRNMCGIELLVPLAMTLLAWRDHPARPPVTWTWLQPRLAESLLVVAATVGAYGLAFAFDGLPLAFPLLVVTVWVGLRLPTVVSLAHSLAVAAGVVVLTHAGVGPFAAVSTPQVAAVLTQTLIASCVLTGLALAVGRDESRLLGHELRRSETDATYQAEVLSAIVGHIDEGIVVVDERGQVLFRNAGAAGMVSLHGAPLRPVTDWSGFGRFLVDGRELAPEEWPLSRAFAGERVRLSALEWAPPVDEGVRWAALPGSRFLDVTASPLPAAPDGVKRALLVMRDTTAEQRQRAELAAFAATAAHDLRTPLTTIEAMTELLEQDLAGGDSRAVLGHGGRIRRASRRMRALVDDLLAHAASGDRALHLAPLDLAALVGEVAADLDVSSSVTVGELPPLRADRVLARQLIANLLANSVKYVDDGVTPDVRVSAEPVAGGLVAVRVADNGVGLPAGQHEKVFEEFHRAHGGRFHGTGLGLAICRRIVERHGGTIRAYDNPAGRGTVLELTLPGA
ncbi:ATP-binding protein [Nocardioides sp. SYSU D00038]|uniref:ATP-binding protein n=1 Tax=Nocardioides sp. SYSU D00038 TaxID=2812554 RepID=UPI001967D7E9|nr:ATP-binding protein [Nocardioides sp. SYSU D00038]